MLNAAIGNNEAYLWTTVVTGKDHDVMNDHN